MRIEALTEDRVDVVADLYRRSWPGEVELRTQALHRVTRGSPFRDDALGCLIVYDDGRAAGCWGRMPMRSYRCGEPIPCVFTQEALVDLKFRRRGTAQTLMEAGLEPELLVRSLWHSHRILAPLRSGGWTDLGPTRAWKGANRPVRLRAAKLPEARPAGAVEPLVWLADRVVEGVRAEPGPASLEVEVVEKTGVRRGTVVDPMCGPEQPEAARALLVEAARRFRYAEPDLAVALVDRPGARVPFQVVASRLVPVRKTWVLRLLLTDRRSPATEALRVGYEGVHLTFSDSDGYMW